MRREHTFIAEPKERCKYPKCTREVDACGNCTKHYQYLMRGVHNGEWTQEELWEADWMDPPYGNKKAEILKRIQVIRAAKAS